MCFVHPLKAGKRNFFHPVSRNPWEAIISGPVVRTADEFEAEEGVVLVSEGALEHDVVGARAQLVQAARDVRLR